LLPAIKFFAVVAVVVVVVIIRDCLLLFVVIGFLFFSVLYIRWLVALFPVAVDN
jgi:hypothetical protein